MARAAAFVRGHARLALAVIVALTLLAVALYVYYHGLWFLGPYAVGGRAAPRGARGKGPAPGPPGGDDADPETERLIRAINSAAR